MTLWSTPTGDEEKQPVQERTDAAGVRASSLLHGKRAVIVEDEGMTVWQLRKMLSLAGIQVVGAASDGRKGVEVVLRERPDLVLMDVTMPIMDGLEATRLILGEFSTCVVMVTAYDRYLAEATELGACGYVVKPVSSETLLPALEAAFHALQRRDSSDPPA